MLFYSATVNADGNCSPSDFGSCRFFFIEIFFANIKKTALWQKYSALALIVYIRLLIALLTLSRRFSK